MFVAATNSLMCGVSTVNVQTQQRTVAVVDQNMDVDVERAGTRRSEAERFCRVTQYM